MIRRPRTGSGFTLVEIVIFIVVVAIAITGVTTVYMQSLAGAGEGPEMTRRIHLAQQRMELIIAIKRLDGFPGEDPCVGNGLNACFVPAGFTVESLIDEWDEQPGDDNYRVITVTVTPPDGDAFTLQSLVTRLEAGT